MLKKINCVSLYSVIPKVQNVAFDRDKVLEDDADIKMAVKNDISENDEENPTKTKLSFSVNAQAKRDDGVVIFEAEIEIEYFFTIKDLETYKSLTDEEQIALCSNLCFLDFRRRLYTLLSGVGMSSVRLPLSLQNFSGDLDASRS